MQPVSLFLIRHAESTWNSAGRWQGQADPPLSASGRAQARRLAADLAGCRIDRVVASDLARAVQTGQVLAQALGVPFDCDRRLRELDVGGWSGRTRAEIRSRDSRLLERFESGDPDVRPGGGESRRSLRRRARRALAELARRHPGRRVAVVTHLGVIRALLDGACPANAGWLRLDWPS